MANCPEKPAKIEESKPESERVRIDPKEIVCYRCGGKGHISRDCPTPRERNQSSEQGN
jgi:hypothetical protein